MLASIGGKACSSPVLALQGIAALERKTPSTGPILAKMAEESVASP